jgi:hypothetical protein
MGGFESLRGALDEGRALEPFLEGELRFSDEQLSDLAALKTVLQDAALAEAYRGSKNLPSEWDRIASLYSAQVPPQTWPNSGGKPKSNLGMPLILESIENLLSQIHMAFFSDPQPFLLEGTGNTKPEAARATAKLLKWAVKQAGFKEEIRKCIKSTLEFGQMGGKWGWQPAEKKTKKFTKSESGVVSSSAERQLLSAPTFEFVELRYLNPDPALRSHDIRLGKSVVHQIFVTASDLDNLRDNPGYKNIPARGDLKRILANMEEPTTDGLIASKTETWRTYQAEKEVVAANADPLNKPLEILEWTSGDRVISVLQRKIVIRNTENEFERINYVSQAFVDVIGSFYGFGVGMLLEGEQRFEQGVVNAWIDGLSLVLNPMWHRKKGVGTQTQNITASPGKVVNDDGDLAPLEKNSVTAEALQAIETSEARANRRVGSNFGSEMPTQAMRTAEGVNSFTSGLQVRLQYFVEQFAENVFIPVLEAFVEMMKENMQPKDIDCILSEDDGKTYEGDHLEIYNGTVSIDVLSSTKLAARRAMVSMVPLLLQLFATEPVQDSLAAQNKKLDYVELVSEVCDLAGWPMQDLIVDATPQDIQRYMQLQPGAQAAQAKAQQSNQDHQNALDLEEHKGTVRAGVQVVKHILDESKSANQLEPMAVQGLINPQPQK